MQNIASAYIYLRPFFLLNMILYVQLRSVTGQEAADVKKKQNRNMKSSEAEDSVCRSVFFFDRNENKGTSFFFFFFFVTEMFI